MQKPTNSEIKEAIENIEDSVYAGILPNNYTVGFKMAVEWVLHWQKSQPLTVYVIKAGESEMVDVFRTPEKAENQLEELKKDHPKVDFYIEIAILD